MSDTTTPGAAPSGSGSALSLPQAVQILADRRAAREADSATPRDENPQELGSPVITPDEGMNGAAAMAQPNPQLPQAADSAAGPQSEGDAQASDEAASIVVDGVALTADDVRRGYMRQADYSRKTQALAATSKKPLTTVKEATLALAQLVGFAPCQRQPLPGIKMLAMALERFHYLKLGFQANSS